MIKHIVSVAACVLVAGASAGGVLAEMPRVSEDHRERGERLVERAIGFLRGQQDGQTGGFNHRPDGPNLPAITGLVVTGMLLDPEIDGNDPTVRKGVEYMLSFVQPDGGIYDRILPSYNTAICVSALSKLGPGEPGYQRAGGVMADGVRRLKSLQYSDEADVESEVGRTTQRVPRSHPFYGGIGYGSSGRPDNSNMQFMMQAFADAGVPADDPAVQRALVFLQRTQMLDKANDMDYADGSTQGGFIYATAPNADSIGIGESKAGTIEETLSDGTVASRLRAYGSMTYAGFKSYAYAELAEDDPRVAAALDWISKNYTLAENPGIGTDGQYYYYLTFSKALDARGKPTLPIESATGPASTHWAEDLIDQLEGMQNEDGSFRSVDDRWMENDPVLITAYSLIALQHALDRDSNNQKEAN